METVIHKAMRKNCSLILEMQLKAFSGLLAKYQDYEISPGNETIESIYRRFDQTFTDYYLIKHHSEVVGAVRVIRIEKDKACRISPIFVLPEYQGNGIAQDTFKILEDIYDGYLVWRLDTILEEKNNCYLYEKLGYKKTGKYEKIKENMTIVYYEKSVIR